MAKMKQIECDKECGFMVRGHDEDEVMDFGMRHVTVQHPDLHATREDMSKRMVEV